MDRHVRFQLGLTITAEAADMLPGDIIRTSLGIAVMIADKSRDRMSAHVTFRISEIRNEGLTP